jgi:hypothetical protein
MPLAEDANKNSKEAIPVVYKLSRYTLSVES